MGNFVELEIARIRELVGPKALVIGGVSGGVDSTVGATLMREAIGDRFIAIGVNNGCMRLNEFEEVKENLRDHLGINLTVVEAGDLFLDRLEGVSDPEKKRKIIGSTCTYSELSCLGLQQWILTVPKSSTCSRRRLLE
jgi:GMP synthase (glutamine-hydrolysing)